MGCIHRVPPPVLTPTGLWPSAKPLPSPSSSTGSPHLPESPEQAWLLPRAPGGPILTLSPPPAAPGGGSPYLVGDPEAAALSRNSSSFSEKQRSQPDSVTKPADKWRWAGNSGRSGLALPASQQSPASQPPQRGVGSLPCMLAKSRRGEGGS